jgi:hypothetical protein
MARAQAMLSAREELPKPKQFPAPLDEVLRLLMPKERSEDRMRFYKNYVRENTEARREANVHGGETQEVSVEQETENWLASDAEIGFKRAYYEFTADEFLEWLPKHKADNRRKRARAGGVGLKQKRQIKKHLGDLIDGETKES